MGSGSKVVNKLQKCGNWTLEAYKNAKLGGNTSQPFSLRCVCVCVCVIDNRERGCRNGEMVLQS